MVDPICKQFISKINEGVCALSDNILRQGKSLEGQDMLCCCPDSFWQEKVW